MKKKLLPTILGCFSLCSLPLTAQVTLPYYSGFDNAAQKAGWAEYKKAATTYSHWGYGSGFSAPSGVGHDYSPSTGITLTDNWFVSPAFSIPAGGTLDSIRYKCAGFSVPATDDTVAVYLLNGSQDPALATSRTLLFDVRGADYVNDYTYKLKTNLVLPASPGNSYIAIRYRNTNCSSKWLTVSFDNVAIRGSSTTGTGDVTNSSDNVTVYPNPAKGKFFIDAGNISGLEVFNLSGEKICSVTEPQHCGESEIDLSGYPAGIYFVRIKKEGSVISKKIILQ
ncbi:MAG: Endonuclease [Bacteroidetes bacterium]|nr:Endonuclease [Bacteroidota bacterium]